MPTPSAPDWDIKSFQLELPRETTPQAAHAAGKHHLEKDLTAHADYSCTGSKPHPTMSGMSIFSYTYKVRKVQPGSS
jgi:hypothetical protein